MNNSFKSLIDSAKSVLILLSTKPTFDQVAAGLALFLALKPQKQTSIVSPTPMTVDFNRLVGVNKISQELGNKNMVIQFADYKATDIERVSYDIEEGKFRLTVIPKPGINAPQKDQVEFSYSGVSSDTVILVGGANESHFTSFFSGELGDAKPVHIGARALSTQKKIVSFGQAASSDSEIMASLIYQSGWKVDGDVSTNLLMGIEEGSEKFSKPEVNANTFAITSELMRAGARRAGQAVSPGAYPPGAIPGQTLQSQSQPQGQLFGQSQGVFATQPAQVQSQQVSQPMQTQPGVSTQSAQPVSNIPASQGAQEQHSPQAARTRPQSDQPSTLVGESGVHIQDNKQEEPKNPPKDWLKPKIFKGTSIN